MVAAKILLLVSLAGVALSLPQGGYDYNAPPPPQRTPPTQRPPSNLYQTPQRSPPAPAPAPPPRPATPRPTPTPRPPQPQQGYGVPAASSNIPQRTPANGGEEGMPYDFNWGVEDSESGNSYSHVETSDGQTMTGEYRVLLPDGRTQVVKFFDNGGGFNADVTYI